MICCASASSVSFTSIPSTASAISACEKTSSETNSVSSTSASPRARTRHRLSRPERTNRPIAAVFDSAHRLQQEHVRPPLRGAGRRHEEVVPVEVDRVDRVFRHELP